MRQLLASTWQFFNPVFDIPAVRERIEFIDDNLLIIGSAAVLATTFVLWANI